MSVVQFPSSCLLYGDIPSTAFLAVGEMSFCTYCTTKVGTFPVFGFDGFNCFSRLDALFTVFIVLVFLVRFAPTQSADRDTGFPAGFTSFGFSILMLHACFVRSRELPADVALNKIDSLFPVVCSNYSGEHDEV